MWNRSETTCPRTRLTGILLYFGHTFLTSAYLTRNVHYTFSGFNFTPTFLDLLLHVGVEHIMFSAHYPYSSMAQARAFLDQLSVSPADRARIAHGNAETLLGLSCE
jgi:predicted TIM-barrel fold metal-dependent hydrolase